ncbi:MAG: hypothetical protein D6732_03835 [Methanobacteriota archaeon]|nr:MAG: hypothetical protein D6732_03835 [Euryarchaeota archaeon]
MGFALAIRKNKKHPFIFLIFSIKNFIFWNIFWTLDGQETAIPIWKRWNQFAIEYFRGSSVATEDVFYL